MEAGHTVADRILISLVLALGAACGKPDASPPAAEAVAAVDTVAIQNPNYVEKPSFFGYITATTLSVRDAPGGAARAVGFVFKGDRVDIYESRDVAGATWLRTADEAGYVDGWISARFVSGSPVAAAPPPPTQYGERRTPTAVMTGTAKYVGTGACRRCHTEPGPGKFPGGEYGVWSTHYHSVAYRTLTRPYAQALAQQKRGVQDPATDWRCVKCHVAAFGVPDERLGPGYRNEEGVTCEVCHGPGSEYLLSHWTGQKGFESREAAGFKVYRNIKERDRVCRSCHNPLSPTYKPFNVAAFSKAIRHWSDEHVFREVAGDREVTTTPPRPIAEAPPPKIDTVVAPPKVTALVAPPPAAATPAPAPAAAPPPARETPPPVAAAKPGPSGSQEGPTDLVLDTKGTRGKVPFPHKEHFKSVAPPPGSEVCITCHHTNKKGEKPKPCSSCHKLEATADTPNAEKAYHSNCKDCHREEQAGPRKCSECHIQ